MREPIDIEGCKHLHTISSFTPGYFPGREKRKLFSHPSLMALNLKASECWGSKWRGDRCGFEK